MPVPGVEHWAATRSARARSRLAAAAGALILAVLLAWITSCSDGGRSPTETRPVVRSDSLPGLLVSGPVPLAGVASVRRPALSPAAGRSLVYVSMPPGSVPTGQRATIQNPATGQTVGATLFNGGFDPVAVAASVGDTLVVDITRGDSARALHGVEPVRANTPPVVVRTEPPPQKVDVPLNAVMIVVFSEPIDSASLVPGSLLVLRDTTPVAGTLRLSDASGLRAEFDPDSLLASQTSYRLVVTRAIRDVIGTPLGADLVVSFTTGASIAPVAPALTFEYALPNAIAGLPMWGEVLVHVVNELGNVATGFNGAVTIDIGANPGGGALSGTSSVTVVAGEAAFVGLSIDRAGSGYTLRASAPGVGSGTSAPFNVEPPIGPTTNLIAFTSDPAFKTSLVDPDGGGLATLPVSGRNPVWSPDGKKIAFSPPPVAGGGWWLGIMNVDGSGAIYVPDIDFCPAWSPDATKLAVYKWGFSGGGRGINVMKADGSGLTRLIDTGETCPVWSPDGAKIAFHAWDGFRTNHVYVMNADGTHVTQITGDSLNAYGPLWSPDGTRIVFTGGAGLYVMNSDGSGVASLYADTAQQVWGSAWSPDGRRIAFMMYAGGGLADLYVANADGSGVVRLTTGMSAQPAVGWSPDGRRITFYGSSSAFGGPDRVYVVNADGSGLTPVTPVLPDPWASSDWPAWRP